MNNTTPYIIIYVHVDWESYAYIESKLSKTNIMKIMHEELDILKKKDKNLAEYQSCSYKIVSFTKGSVRLNSALNGIGVFTLEEWLKFQTFNVHKDSTEDRVIYE